MNALKAAVITSGVLVGVWYIERPSRTPVFEKANVDRGDVRSMVNANGTCAAVVTVQVGSQVSGNIKTLYADFNSRIHKGQLLAEIDPAPFIARRDQAQAALESTQANVLAANAAVAKAQADLRSAQFQRENQVASVALARSVEQDSQTKYDRRRVEGTGIISPEDLETAQTTFQLAVAGRQAAESQEEAAEDTVRAAQNDLEVARTQVDSAKSQVEQAEAVLQQATLDLEHTRITAPIDGVVISRDVDVGQTVAASFQAPELFQIAQDLTRMEVQVNIDESDVSRLRTGEPATFSVDALPNETFDATVTQIRKNPINVQNVITYVAVLSFDNPEQKLFPGMTANVHILAGVHRNVLRVPNSALRFHPLGTRNALPAGFTGLRPPFAVIYIPDSAGKPEPRKIETGFGDGAFTEISPGALNEGDVVVTGESDFTT